MFAESASVGSWTSNVCVSKSADEVHAHLNVHYGWLCALKIHRVSSLIAYTDTWYAVIGTCAWIKI